MIQVFWLVLMVQFSFDRSLLPVFQMPPRMSEEHRRKIENEAKSWLQIQTHKSALEIGAG